MELLKDKLFNGISFEILKEGIGQSSWRPFQVTMRVTNTNEKKKKLSINVNYISIHHGLKKGSVLCFSFGSYGSFLQSHAFVDMNLDFCENYQNEIEQACDGDRMELIVNDGKIASLLLIRDGGKWYITESSESGSINTNIKNKIEHFEYLEEKFGLTLQKFSVRVIDENSLDLFCEVLAMNGEVGEDGFNIEVAIYDADDNIVKLDSISRYDNDFKGFEVFHFGPIKLDISVEEISKIRIYPTR